MKMCSSLNVTIKMALCVIYHDCPKEIYTFYWNVYRKSYPDLQKEKQNRNGQELWLKVKRDQEQYEKIIELKRRAA